MFKVPLGTTELWIEADEEQVSRMAASHSNWQTTNSPENYEIEVWCT